MTDYSNQKTDLTWYRNESVTDLAKGLLGKLLCTREDGRTTKGMIVEAEAYCGRNDKACHANGNRMTRRNKIMFSSGGHAYVYLCYGIHHLFNVVTNSEGFADAVLIRALEPVEGADIMKERRNMLSLQKRLTSGPGALSQAMGISLTHYGERLDGDRIWIEQGIEIDPGLILATTRVGVEYAGEDAQKPWRFYIRGNTWVSKF